MKKYYIIIFLILFVSCDSVFHEIDNPYLDIDTEQEKLDMLNGIYSRLSKVHEEDYLALLSRSDDVNNYTNLLGIHDVNGGCGRDIGPIDYPAIIGNIYLNLYIAIININKLLTVVPLEEESSLAGELYFLRAYSYFKLQRFFGTPPIVLDTDVKYLVEKPEFIDVFNQIEEDLLNALDLLPDTYTDARIPGETPHKGTAKAMLAEVYLSMGGFPLNDGSKYAEAARLAKEVMDKSDYYNFHLIDDFAELWQDKNIPISENIFGLFFSGETEELSNPFLKVRGGGSYGMQYMVSASYYHPNFNFFLDFPFNYRKLNSFVLGTYRDVRFNSIDSLVISLDFHPFDPFNEGCDYADHAGCLKWIYEVYNSRGNFSIFGENENKTAQTLYLLRYAQLLLTYAEAKARSGELDATAFEAVNQIRRRANNVDLYSSSKFDLQPDLNANQFIDSVVWERAWELAMEPDGRWFDIIRLDLIDHVKDNLEGGYKNTVVPEKYLTDLWYYYKIPQEDRWIDPYFE